MSELELLAKVVEGLGADAANAFIAYTVLTSGVKVFIAWLICRTVITIVRMQHEK